MSCSGVEGDGTGVHHGQLFWLSQADVGTLGSAGISLVPVALTEYAGHGHGRGMAKSRRRRHPCIWCRRSRCVATLLDASLVTHGRGAAR